MDDDYNFASKVLLNAKAVEKLEAEFESQLTAKNYEPNLKYFEVAIRYKDERVIPYIENVYEIGNEHLKSMCVYVLGEINSKESISKVREIYSESEGIVQYYARNQLLKTGNLETDYEIRFAFDTIPILDKRGFVKEPFLFKDVVDGRLVLRNARTDKEKENTSLAVKVVKPTKLFRDTLLDTPELNNFWYDVGKTYHSGLDNSWDWPGLPIYASMSGKVKLIWLDLSWGIMIAIESYYQGEPITQIYGHLANEITVEVGDYIEAGKLLGFVGKGMTVTNGGYRAHLHFGLERCAFDVCHLSGYHINRKRWLNPLQFIPN